MPIKRSHATNALDISAVLGVASRATLSTVFLAGGRAVWSNPARPAAGVAPFLAGLKKKLPLLSGVSDEQLVRLNAAVMVGGGLALSTGVATRTGAMLLLGSLAPTTVAAFPFWKMPDGPQRMQAHSDFLKNLSVAGGLLGVWVGNGFGGFRAPVGGG